MGWNKRFDAKRDANEPEIRQAFSDCGCKTYQINEKDVPDLLCRYAGRWFPVEVKNPEGENIVTREQLEFLDESREFNAPAFLVRSVEDVPLVLEIVRTWGET